MAVLGPLAPLLAARFQSHQLFTLLEPGSKVSLLTSDQVSFPAASRRVWVLMYAFPDVRAVKGDTGPLLEHPLHNPS